MIQNLRRLFILVLVLASPVWVSMLIWYLSPELPLKVKLIDYTVPFDNYAEHSASVWAFNHIKLTPTSGKEKWLKPTDYVGPPPFRPYVKRRLSEQGSLDRFDLIYIADTYGVYQDDFKATVEIDGRETHVNASDQPEMLKEMFDEGAINVHMDYSQLIFGGLSIEDIKVLEEHVQQGRDLILEFNSLCDPTPMDARARAEHLIGMEWTGWSGRFFLNLYDPDDTPRWLPRLFKEQYPNSTMPTDPSLLLIHRNGRLFLISDPKYANVIPYLNVKTEHQERFGIFNYPPYFFWFAVMRPLRDTLVGPIDIQRIEPKATILAEIELPLIKGSDVIYQMLEIPRKIPLLTEYIVGTSHRYHLAIDGSDIRDQLGKYTFAGLASLNSISAKNRGISVSQRPTFWQFYLPMIRQLMWERSSAHYDDFPLPWYRRLSRWTSHLMGDLWGE